MIKKRILISLLFLFSAFLFFSFQSTQAQSFTLKLQGRSPGQLGLDPRTAVTWPTSAGLSVVAKGEKVYLQADTAGTGISFAWAITQKPAGSAAALDSTGTRGNSFTADSTGSYTVTVTVGAKTLTQNIFVSTYRGSSINQNCAPCHQTPKTSDKYNKWRVSSHATMYKRGISGLLAVSNGNGIYGTYCVKCHTTGWDPTLNNGNYGYRAKVTGWDTTWYKPAAPVNDIVTIPQGDSSRWVKLQTQFPTVEPVATIGCEQCHGPANDHAMTADPTKVDVSINGGVCNQCHDAPNRYIIGSQWAMSNHATLKLSSEEAGRTACYPCHSGNAIIKFAKNKTTPGYNVTEDNIPSIACASCHDPHGNANPSSVRLVALDSLANGYKPTSTPGFKSGTGGMCMNCHRARENSFVRVTNQAKKFADRFYPHYSPQSDMLLGANGYEYDLTITGQNTHAFLPNSCATCHMAPNPDSTANPNGEANHLMTMKENEKDRIYACKGCHPSVTTSFNDVKAKSDYDGDGTVEGAQSEIQGLLDKLKAVLPKDSTGEVVTMAKDSMLVKNHPGYPRILPAMWDYYFVRNDWSKGVHNAKYAVALLQRSLAQVTGVEQVNNKTMPSTFTLEQNYPNPFNPVTTISFSVPENANITITVYDAVGKEIATLFRGNLNPGNYKVQWNPANAASGIYYYKLSTDKFSEVKKMVFLK